MTGKTELDSIRLEKERLFQQIKSAEEGLKELRKLCPHERTEECIWSWRIGCYDPAIICSDCGEFLKYIEGDLPHFYEPLNLK